MPGSCGLQFVIHIVDILHAFGLQPLAEGGCALFGVNGNAFFPGGPAAQHAVELHAGFGGEFERFRELGIAYAGGKINERFGGNRRRRVKQVNRLLLAVGRLAAEGLCACNELHVNRHFDLENVHAVAVFGEFFHAPGYDQGLLLGVLKALFVGALFIADEFQEERNVVGAALVAQALYPGMLLVVYILGIEWRVVKQNLDAIGAGVFEALRGPMVEQIAQTAGASLVVSRLLIGEQQAGILGAALGGGETPLGIEQNGGGVWGQNFADQRFEFFHHGVADFAAFFLCQRLL